MRLIDFFDDADDMAECLEFAARHMLPAIDKADALIDPERHAKISTALFILFTYRAVTVHGLDAETAHPIIDELLVAIQEGHLTELLTLTRGS